MCRIIKYLVVIFVLFNLNGFTQTRTKYVKKQLTGKWIGTCGTEYMDQNELLYSEICPTFIDPKDDSRAQIKEVDIIFSEDSLRLNRSGEWTVVSFRQNEDTQAIQFILDEKVYQFRVFYVDEKVILEEKDGTVLLLRPTL